MSPCDLVWVAFVVVDDVVVVIVVVVVVSEDVRERKTDMMKYSRNTNRKGALSFCRSVRNLLSFSLIKLNGVFSH